MMIRSRLLPLFMGGLSVKSQTHHLSPLYSLSQQPKRHESSFQISSATQSRHADIVRPITLRTCVGIYPDLQRRFPTVFPRKVPKDGLDLTVEYADTALDPNYTLSSYDKTIVAIHGNPGYLRHFDSLVDHYRGSRTRVVVPNLPDFSHTRSTGHVFWHTTPEKVSFVMDFLRALDLQRIDCLVAHSFGIQTAGGLLDEKSLQIGSVALFAPQPLWVPPSFDLIDRMNRVFRFKSSIWYRLLDWMKIWEPSDDRPAIKFENLNELLMLCTHVLDLESPRLLHGRLERFVRNTKAPLTIVYGSGENLVTPRNMELLHAKFGLGRDDVVRVDPASPLHTEALMPNGYRFNSYFIRGGGHFVHAKCAPQVNVLVDQLLDYVPGPDRPLTSAQEEESTRETT